MAADFAFALENSEPKSAIIYAETSCEQVIEQIYKSLLEQTETLKFPPLTDDEISIILAFLAKAKILALRGQMGFKQLALEYIEDILPTIDNGNIIPASQNAILTLTIITNYLEENIFNVNTMEVNQNNIENTNIITVAEKKVKSMDLSPLDRYRAETFLSYLKRMSLEMLTGSYTEAGMSLSTIEFNLENIKANKQLWEILAPFYLSMLEASIDSIYERALLSDITAKVLLERLYKLLEETKKVISLKGNSSFESKPLVAEINMNPIDISFLDIREDMDFTLNDLLRAMSEIRAEFRLNNPRDNGAILNIENIDDQTINTEIRDYFEREGLTEEYKNFAAIRYVLELMVGEHRNKIRKIFEYLAYEEVARLNANNVVVPALMSTITDEPIVPRGSDRVGISYQKRLKEDGTEEQVVLLDEDEKANFEWIMNTLEKRVEDMALNLELAERPREADAKEKWELENIINPLNELMLIFNKHLANLLPAKTSETGKGAFIAEDWDVMGKYLDLKNNQSFTDYLFAKVSREYLFKMLDILNKVLKLLVKSEILHKVIVGYQGVGKGAFGRTNKRVIEQLNNFQLLDIETQSNDVEDLRNFIRKTFGANIGETGTGTDRVSVPMDGDKRFNYAAPIARTTLSELVKGGGMVNDDFMTLMVVFEMIKIVLQGYDGADVDTFPRTPGQLEMMQNVIIPYLEERKIAYKTSYQIYEMADAETSQLIMENRDSASLASKVLSGELTKLSKKDGYIAAFPDSDLVATDTIGKKSTADLDKNDIEPLKAFYRDRAMEIREYLLDKDRIDALFTRSTVKRDIVIKIYTAHVEGFTKIIGQRVAGRLIAEKRGDDNIIYSLLNRIRSTEGTYGNFVKGVAEDVIGVDGKPSEAWEMWIKAQLRSANPQLLEKLEHEFVDDVELRSLWLMLLEIGKTQHELTINPAPVEA